MNKTLSTLMIMGGVAIATTAFAKDDNKFKSMDTNNDGQISSAEHAAGVTKMFSTMDADKDGFVTAAEMDAGSMKMKSHSEMKMSSSEKIKTMDTDGDGKLSAAEHDAGAASMFTKADKDGNGSISQAEMASGREKMERKADTKYDKSDKSGMHDEHGTSDAGSGTDATTPPAGG